MFVPKRIVVPKTMGFIYRVSLTCCMCVCVLYVLNSFFSVHNFLICFFVDVFVVVVVAFLSHLLRCLHWNISTTIALNTTKNASNDIITLLWAFYENNSFLNLCKNCVDVSSFISVWLSTFRSLRFRLFPHFSTNIIFIWIFRFALIGCFDIR